jgi:hypothetical protein
MLGTIVNTGAIIAGGLIGLLFQKRLNEKLEDAIHKALGLSILILGLNGVISAMFTVQDGKIKSSGELLLIVSLVLGAAAGELLKIEDRLGRASLLVEKKMKLKGFAAGFVSGTLIYCVGAMAIVGAISDGLRGDSSVLLIKSLLDGISSVVLGSTLGIGVVFSSLSVLLYQGSLSLLAGLIGPLLSDTLLDWICMVGYCIVMSIGINFLGMTKIKTANLLPALIVPVLYFLIRSAFVK